MISIQDLEKTTSKFFNDLCRKDISKPTWSSKWMFKGELPNNSAKGCYAHLNGNKVIYIGVAIGDSNKGSGIGSRVSNYWKYDSNKNGIRIYNPTVKGIDAIITLPFTTDDFFLAAALEIYLIQHLEPPNNKVHSKYN